MGLLVAEEFASAVRTSPWDDAPWCMLSDWLLENEFPDAQVRRVRVLRNAVRTALRLPLLHDTDYDPGARDILQQRRDAARRAWARVPGPDDRGQRMVYVRVRHHNRKDALDGRLGRDQLVRALLSGPGGFSAGLLAEVRHVEIEIPHDNLFPVTFRVRPINIVIGGREGPVLLRRRWLGEPEWTDLMDLVDPARWGAASPDPLCELLFRDWGGPEGEWFRRRTGVPASKATGATECLFIDGPADGSRMGAPNNAHTMIFPVLGDVRPLLNYGLSHGELETAMYRREELAWASPCGGSVAAMRVFVHEGTR